MKYCIIYSEKQNISKDTIDAVNFYQWANALNGEIHHIDDILPNFQDGQYDLVHFRLTEENLISIQAIREKIGRRGATKIMASLDIPPGLWDVEFSNTETLLHTTKLIDFITATQYAIAESLGRFINKRVIDIPYPADLDKIRSYKTHHINRKLITVLNDSPIDQYKIIKGLNFKYLRPFLYVFRKRIHYILKKIVGASLTFIYYREQYDSERLSDFHYNKIKRSPFAITTLNEQELCDILCNSKLVLSMYKEPSHGKLVIYAAALECQLVGQIHTEAAGRCYPQNVHAYEDYKNYGRSFWWLCKTRLSNEFFPTNAMNKVEYYNFANMRKKMLDFLWDETNKEVFKYTSERGLNIKKDYFESMELVSGPAQITYGLFECVVVCPIRDGEEFIHTYLTHYRALGVKHFIFVDNGSKDNTLNILSNQNDVTLYKTSLKFSHYEAEMREILIQHHCRGRWVLCTDSDELFEFPFSDKISLSQFLEYQYNKEYTAVVAYMLDMFGDENVYKSSTYSINDNLKELYPYYDISNVEKEDYFKNRHGYNSYNKIANKNIVCSYGGIRNHHFKPSSHKIMNLKHPLLFIDGIISPFLNPHYSNKAKISDVSCILRHYKFTKSLKERIYKFFEYKSDNIYHNEEYKAYYKVLKDKDSFDLCSNTSEKYIHVNQLIDSEFITTSKDYEQWVETAKPSRPSITEVAIKPIL